MSIFFYWGSCKEICRALFGGRGKWQNFQSNFSFSFIEFVLVPFQSGFVGVFSLPGATCGGTTSPGGWTLGAGIRYQNFSDCDGSQPAELPFWTKQMCFIGCQRLLCKQERRWWKRRRRSPKWTSFVQPTRTHRQHDNIWQPRTLKIFIQV